MKNGGKSEIIGIWDIVLIMSLGYRLVLKNIRHISNIYLNLLSIWVLDEEGYYSVFGDDKWKLIKKSLVAARGIKQDSLCFMQAKVSKGGERSEKIFYLKIVASTIRIYDPKWDIIFDQEEYSFYWWFWIEDIQKLPDR